MNEEIKVGLDFGTHQTKVCVQVTPDEGHGQPRYEFFKFVDLLGKEEYFLPSVIQINSDDTLSYGFVDSQERKSMPSRPTLDTSYLTKYKFDFDKDAKANELYNKYATSANTEDDITVLKAMLGKLRLQMKNEQRKLKDEAQRKYESEMSKYKSEANIFRYFKQATFSIRTWNMKIPAVTLSIWYVSYVIFLLEEKYGKNFSINMGIPTDNDDYESKKKLAVEVLLTAYALVEDVYANEKEKFLSETVDNLLLITEANYKHFTQEQKELYNINIFPEAYSGLISLTSKGRIATGMSLTADIGGGTTDISFFIIQENKPVIYRYWSIPYGLNYIAEASGFDYQDEDLANNAKEQAIDTFNSFKDKVVGILINDLVKQFHKEKIGISVTNLYDALRNRIIVYNGGGSLYPRLTTTVGEFTDVKVINSNLWKEENIIDKTNVEKYCQLLTTAYGLSLSESDEDVKVAPFTSLFDTLPRRVKVERNMVDKDQV